MTTHCDTCKAAIPEDDIDDCTVLVGGPEDRDSIHLCRTCFDEHEAEMEATARRYKAEYDAAPLSERDPAEYRRQTREAGRGHLGDGASHLIDRADLERKRMKGE